MATRRQETLVKGWRAWPVYSEACRRDVQMLLRNGHSLTAYQANPKVGLGPREGSWAWTLEEEAKRVHGVKHVVACSSATTGLIALLRALNLPPEGEVITTALTFSATVSAILLAGLTPVFADVDPLTCCLSDETVREVLSARTVAVLTVNLFGHETFLSALNIPVVYDASQSVGRPPSGQYGVWSFNGRKNVPAGEGGAVFCNDAGLARVRWLLNHGENFRGGLVGENGHLNELSACVATHGMRAVMKRNQQRGRAARWLKEALTQLDPPVVYPILTNHALYVYPLILPNVGVRIGDILQSRGIECHLGYIQPPLHQYPRFRGLRRGSLNVTEGLSARDLLIFPQVTPTATRAEMRALGQAIGEAAASLTLKARG